MAFKSHARRFAAWLLRSALNVAPLYAADWGRAMLGELQHVEGDWAALAWSFGGSGVLLKHALLAAVIPGQAGQGASAENSFFAKENPMRKSSLITAAACLVSSLLFFAAPTFRQAFRVSLKQWDQLDTYDARVHKSDRDIEALAARSRANHDAEGLAFAALHDNDDAHSAHLADEAVALDPRLTWVYAPVAVEHPTVPDIPAWINKLQAFDPQNAIQRLILVEKIDIDGEVPGKLRTLKDVETPTWQSAMADAFAAPKFDSYGDRVNALNRDVVQRYGFGDPYVVQDTQRFWLPSYAVSNSAEYAQLLIASGDDLAAHHDDQGAAQKYLAVATFLSRMNTSPNQSGYVAHAHEIAYERLASLARAHGDISQARIYSQMEAQIEQSQAAWRASLVERLDGGLVARWEAGVVKVSGAIMLVCAILLGVSLAGALVRTRSFRWRELRTRRLSLMIGFSSAIGLLISSAALYLTYRPYARIFKDYLVTGSGARVSDLTDFLVRAEVPLDIPAQQGVVSSFSVHFWSALIMLCAIGLLVAAIRFFARAQRNTAAA